MREKADWAKKFNEQIASILRDNEALRNLGYPDPSVINLTNVDGVWTQPKTSRTEVARVTIKTEFVKVEQENNSGTGT